MRVPVPIVIVACLLAVILAWLIGTHDKDFAKPPTPKELVEVAKDWEKDRPGIPLSQAAENPSPATEQNGVSTPPAAQSPGITAILPHLNLQQSPALSEFGTLGDMGAALLVELASHLETQGQSERALLAWERVIDTADPTPDERQQAIAAIKRLKESVPPWNPDPANDIALTIHAGAALQDTRVLQQALEQTAALISEASGNILKVDTRTAIGKAGGGPVTPIPVAIWFSRPGKSSGDPRAESPPISVMADLSEADLLSSRIATSAYSLIRNHLARETGFTPLPALPADTEINPDELLACHITRLMWREFVKSLKD